MQIYLAPMEGITTFVYRNALNRHYGYIDKYFTPFIASRKLNYKEINDVLPEHNRDISLVPQILTNQAEVFLAIADQLADYGYQEVNLNLGCPSGTVVPKKRGAGFLSVPGLLDAFLEEIFEKCSLKISLKTRIGIASPDEWNDILEIFAKYPLSELIIHPRLQREFYGGTPHAEAFRLALDTLSVPLAYNGDINSPASLDSLKQRFPELDTIMVGRGVLCDPKLPARLTSQTSREADTLLREKSPNQKKSPAPETSFRARDLKTFSAFHDEILAGYTELMSGEQPTLFHMKELWSYMGRYLELSDRQLKKIQKAKHLSEYQSAVREFLG